MDVVYDHVVEAEADDYYVGNEAVGEEDNGEPMLMGSGTMQFRALRRTLKKSNRYVFPVIPDKFSTRGDKYQSASLFIHSLNLTLYNLSYNLMMNRRISDMLNSESRRLTTALESVTDESDRRFSELFNLTTEMFEDQVRRSAVKFDLFGRDQCFKHKFNYINLPLLLASPTGKVRKPPSGAIPMLPGDKFRRKRSQGVDIGGVAFARHGGRPSAGAKGRAEAEADALRLGPGGCCCEGIIETLFTLIILHNVHIHRCRKSPNAAT